VVVKANRPVQVTVLNTGKVAHDWSVQGLPGAEHVHAPPGQAASAVFTPTRVGTFEVICTEPGHAQAGMVGELVVEP
jgi:nitrite reductase (NO-forming)